MSELQQHSISPELLPTDTACPSVSEVLEKANEAALLDHLSSKESATTQHGISGSGKNELGIKKHLFV